MSARKTSKPSSCAPKESDAVPWTPATKVGDRIRLTHAHPWAQHIADVIYVGPGPGPFAAETWVKASIAIGDFIGQEVFLTHPRDFRVISPSPSKDLIPVSALRFR